MGCDHEKPWTRAKDVCRTLEYDAKTSRIVKNHSSKENSLISGNWQDSLRNQLIGLEIHRNWIRISMRKG